MTTARRAALGAAATTALLAGAGPFGCARDCEIEVPRGPVDGEYSYTEPAVARDARARRILDAQAGAIRDAELARGPARTVEDHRSLPFLVSPSTGDGRLSVRSNTRDLYRTLHAVTLSFDVPPSEGTYALSALRATLCENVSFVQEGNPSAPYETRAVCGDVAGTVAFRPSGARADADFVADVAFANPAAAAEAPSLRGAMHLQYGSVTEAVSCGGFGRLPGYD